jgi:hypothetical protein
MKNFTQLLAFYISITVLDPSTSLAQAGSVSTAVGGVVAIEKMRGNITGVIQEATQSGDFLRAQLAASAKDILDRWEEVNGNLINKSTKEFEQKSAELLGRIQAVLNDTNSKIEDRIRQLEAFSTNFNQAVADIPTSGKPTYILDYTPRVIFPTATGEINVKIYGVNIDKGSPTLEFGETSIQPLGAIAKEARFKVPLTLLEPNPHKVVVQTLPLQYKTAYGSIWRRIFGRQTTFRALSIVILPTNVATITLNYKSPVEHREEKAFTQDVGVFSGRNRSVYRTAQPPEGWKWNLEKPFSVRGGGGEAARVQGVEIGQSNPYGVVVRARCDQIRKVSGFPPRVRIADGHIRGYLTGTVYRSVKSDEDGPQQTRDISWIKDEKILIPSNITSFTLYVNIFDGKVRVFSTSGDDKFFSVTKVSDGIIIHPKIPSDM